LLGGNLGQYKCVTDLICQLKGGNTTNELLTKVLRYAAPHWVPAETIGQLSAVMSSLSTQDDGGAAVLNGAQVADYTARMYVERAYPLEYKYKVKPLSGGSGGNFLDDYTEQICEVFRRLRNSHEANDCIIERLAKQQPWLFIVLPPPVDVETVKLLKKRFPRVVFLLLHDVDSEDLPKGLEAICLAPPVDPEREGIEYEDWDAARGVLMG
jgi:hypothetical protein